MNTFNLTKKETRLFKSLNTPSKIQDFLNTIPQNFDEDGPIVISPRKVLELNKAHCVEGALLAAAILWYHGHKPLLMDIKTLRSQNDSDHVVTLFKHNGYWGALSKTNHGVLRYREPIYKTLRELALSYFHEYFLNDTGIKTMRSYSKAHNLSQYGTKWITSEEDLYEISADLDEIAHFDVVPKHLKLRKADKVEIEAGKIVEWQK